MPNHSFHNSFHLFNIWSSVYHLSIPLFSLFSLISFITPLYTHLTALFPISGIPFLLPFASSFLPLFVSFSSPFSWMVHLFTLFLLILPHPVTFPLTIFTSFSPPVLFTPLRPSPDLSSYYFQHPFFSPRSHLCSSIKGSGYSLLPSPPLPSRDLKRSVV